MTHSLLVHGIATFVLLSLSTPHLAFTQEWLLPAIVKEGTPSDAFKYDPVVPANQGGTTLTNGSGGITQDLKDQIPFHFINNGKPGNISSFIGLGQGSEETDVNTLGIPLNGPQGGGFDLSSFPQYIWSGFSYQIGPSQGAFDPRGTAGSLTLVPWTQQALTTSEKFSRITSTYSTAHIGQLSAGTKVKDQFAIVAGNSFDQVTGPAGSLSGRWGSGKISGKYHILVTDQTAKNLQSFRSGASAQQTTLRYIPVLQMDSQLSSTSLLKTSVFFDSTYLRSDDPVRPTRTHVRQLGADSVYLFDAWKVGAGARSVDVNSVQISPPKEYLGNFQLTRSTVWNELLIEPSFQVVGVSRKGFAPMGTLGVRKELPPMEGSKAGVFARLSYNKKFPSLNDRYYVIRTPFFTFIGNPELQPEKVYTLTLGIDSSNAFASSSLEGYVQAKRNSKINTYDAATNISSTGNGGSGAVSALIHSLNVHPTGWLDLHNRLSLTHSNVESTQQQFQYLPKFSDALSADFHEAGDQPRWGVSPAARFSGKYLGVTQNLPGYAYFDLNAQVQLIKDVHLIGGIENLTDRKLELVEDSPLEGRYYTIGLSAQL